MELRSSITFIGDEDTLNIIDVLLNDDSIIDDMVSSIDYIPELETADTNVWRVECTGSEWVNIYEIQSRIEAKVAKLKYDIIYASTDSKTYIDVISISGNFDSYLDTDPDKLQEMCDTYGLEFYGSVEDDEDDFVDSDDDTDSYY